MRDIRAGRDINVEGDMIVNDHSQEYKLLIQCTNDELVEEEKHRQNNFENERSERFNKLISAVALAAILLFVAGIWHWYRGQIDLFSLLTGAAGFIVGLASLNVYSKPTVFEQRQMAALHEIHMLLRERGVRR